MVVLHVLIWQSYVIVLIVTSVMSIDSTHPPPTPPAIPHPFLGDWPMRPLCLFGQTSGTRPTIQHVSHIHDTMHLNVTSCKSLYYDLCGNHAKYGIHTVKNRYNTWYSFQSVLMDCIRNFICLTNMDSTMTATDNKWGVSIKWRHYCSLCSVSICLISHLHISGRYPDY